MKQIIIKTLPFLTLLIGLSSCLKEAPMNIDVSKTNSVIEFNNTGDNKATASSEYPRFHIDLGTLAPGDSASFNVNVSYSGADVAPQDITVTLAIDEAALEKYNAQDGTDFVVPSSSIFNLPTTVVIKQGTRQTQIKVSITSNADFDFNLSYALPLKITTASTGIVSANFGTAIYSFGARNQYDGAYSIKGYILREGDDVLSGNYDSYEVNMLTSGANSIQYEYHPWRDGSSVGGIDGLTLQIDPATNKVKVFSTSNPALVNLPGYDSRYDPDTKTFYVSYYWGAGPTNRAATDTLTYIGPR